MKERASLENLTSTKRYCASSVTLATENSGGVMHMLHVHRRGTKAFTCDTTHANHRGNKVSTRRASVCARRANLGLSVAS